MNKNPGGLLDREWTPPDRREETPGEKERREAIDAIANRFQDACPDYVAALRRESKDSLIRRLVRSLAESSYENAIVNSHADGIAPNVEAIHAWHQKLVETSGVKQLSALKGLTKALMAHAGSNTELRELANYTVGGLEMLVRLDPHVKTRRKQKIAGKARGVDQTVKKEARRKTIEDAEHKLIGKIKRHTITKTIARSTGMQTDYVRKVRKKITQK